MRIYIPPQVTHLLFFLIIFIVIFSLVRRSLVPDTFGEYGHYRGASISDNAKHNIVYAGQDSCISCHQDIYDLKQEDLHYELNCESCHDSGNEHVKSPDRVNSYIPEGRDFCGLCHSQNAARSDDVVFQIDLNEHYIDKNCIDCHNPHQPWEIEK